AEAETAMAVYRRQQTRSARIPTLGKQPRGSAILAAGLKKLARIDMDTAAQLWQVWSESGVLPSGDSFAAPNAIARQLISARGGAALPWLISSDPKGHDSYLLEWRGRPALGDT